MKSCYVADNVAGRWSIGVAVVTSVVAWAGSALVFIPVAGYIAVRMVIDAREEIPPMEANAPLIGTARSEDDHQRSRPRVGSAELRA